MNTDLIIQNEKYLGGTCNSKGGGRDFFVQEIDLQQNSQSSQEVFCQHFRRFCYQETLGPREALSQLQELCCQWLIPENHKKEQILQLLVLEQFVAILPEELQAWVREHHPESGEEVVTVLEDLERELDEPRQQVRNWEGPSSVKNLSAWVQGRVSGVNFTLTAANSGSGHYYLITGADE